MLVFEDTVIIDCISFSALTHKEVTRAQEALIMVKLTTINI